jgi:hypothetical protein
MNKEINKLVSGVALSVQAATVVYTIQIVIFFIPYNFVLPFFAFRLQYI